MGTPPVDKTDKADQSGKTDKSADAAATGQQARAADADTRLRRNKPALRSGARNRPAHPISDLPLDPHVA